MYCDWHTKAATIIRIHLAHAASHSGSKWCMHSSVPSILRRIRGKRRVVCSKSTTFFYLHGRTERVHRPEEGYRWHPVGEVPPLDASLFLLRIHPNNDGFFVRRGSAAVGNYASKRRKFSTPDCRLGVRARCSVEREI